MIRGMGMSVRLLTLLIEEIKQQGGSEEILHFLTVERGRENLTKIAQFITSLDWKVPKSVVMELARKFSAEEYHGEIVASDEKFFWEVAMKHLGIPFLRFTADEPDENWPVPDEIKNQLHGKPLSVGMTIDWASEPYILASFAPQNELAREGMIIDMDDLHFIHLSPARYFDLEN